MKIDAHQHFWKYNPAEYSWIDESMSVIRKNFLPENLKYIMTDTGIDGTVAVQARQILHETEWLLKLAEENSFIRGVVGWLPLIESGIEKDLEHFSSFSKLKAVRHVVQDESDAFLLRPDFNRGIKLLKKYKIAYDILIFEKQIPTTIEFVDMHPEQIFILDHAAKPLIKSNVIEPWRKNIKSLAKRRNVYCKISGMATEADLQNWTTNQLKPYFETILECFTPGRLMFSSDWPVCLQSCSYKMWHETVKNWINDLSKSEKSRIMGGTAIEAYNLNLQEIK